MKKRQFNVFFIAFKIIIIIYLVNFFYDEHLWPNSGPGIYFMTLNTNIHKNIYHRFIYYYNLQSRME